MKLSLEERRRRRKAEQQRKLMEESQRAEEELFASQQQSQQRSQQDEEEEKETEKEPRSKKRKLMERSLLDSSSSSSSSSGSDDNEASPGLLGNTSWNPKKSAATDNIKANAAPAAAAVDAPNATVGQYSSFPSRQRLLQPSPSTPGLGPLVNVYANTLLDASPQSSVSMSQPLHTTTTTININHRRHDSSAAYSVGDNGDDMDKDEKDKKHNFMSQKQEAIAEKYASLTSTTTTATTTTMGNNKPSLWRQQQQGAAAAVARRRPLHSRSDSSSSDDSVPNNLAIYRKIQADAAAAKAKQEQNNNNNNTGNHKTSLNNNHNSSTALGSSSSNNNTATNNNNNNIQIKDPPGVHPSVAAAPLVSSHDKQSSSSSGGGGGGSNNNINNKRPWQWRKAEQPSKKKNPKNKWGKSQHLRSNSNDSSSDDDDSVPNNLAILQQLQADAAAAKLAAKKDTTVITEAYKPKENQQSATSSLLETTTKQTPSPPTVSTTAKTNTPHNPLARMKEEARQLATFTTTTSTTHTGSPALNEDYARQLDEDDDEEEEQKEEEEAIKKKKNKEKKKGKNKKNSSSDSSSTSFAWKTDTAVTSSNSLSSSPIAFLENIEGRDEDELCNEYKPVFRDNQVLFTPHALEPIKLVVVIPTNDDAADDAVKETNNGQQTQEYEIPGSMARYMYDFQHEGIRFMFNAIMKHHGAILGDDMGLGKTIQTIGLLAALLRKKGTGADLLELHRRAQMTEGIKRKVEEAKQEALRNGELYRPTEPSSKSTPLSVQQPEWGPILILAPAAVCKSWMTSFKVWGHFSTTEFASKADLENIKLGSVEILVATHNRIQDADSAACLREIPWKLVIVDEFHVFKNESAIKTKNLRLLRDDHNAVILGLSGTCMQNNHKELWNLFDIISKGYLGPWREFQTKISKPIMIGRTKDGNPHAVELGYKAAEQLSSRLYQILIERKKEEVLKDGLPSKDERIVFCELSPLQKRIYKNMVAKPDFVFLKMASSPCDCGINQKFFYDLQQLSSDEERIEYRRRHKDELITRASCCYKVPETYRGSGEIHPDAILWRRQHENGQQCGLCPFCISFSALSLLIKLSSHIDLIRPKAHPDSPLLSSAERKEAETKLELAKAFIPKDVINKDELPSYILEDSIMDDHFSLSGKMAVLARLLKTINHQRGRVLVFSAYTQSLDLLENYVKASGYSFLRMDGTTPRHKRQDLADEFNNSPEILLFLLSTKAMGLGLNLTSANFVIIFDVEWNPSWDSQAQDRSYRIGQKREVTVFRLVSRGTLEEQKYLRQVYKTQLKRETMVDVANPERERAVRIFRGVANDPSRRGELFGLSNLLRYEDGCLMKYGAEAEEARQFGQHGIYSVESIVEAAKKIVPAEDGLEETSIGIGVPDIAKRSEQIDEEAKGGGGESESEDEMIGAESQFVLEMYDKDGDALAGNNANIATSTSDSGPTENGVAADSVPSLAKSDAAATAAATWAGGDIAPTTANTALKREMDDSTPYGNVSSMETAKLPDISSSATLDTVATTEEGGGGIVSVAAKTVVKHEMDNSPSSNNNESSKAMANAKSTMEGGRVMAPPAAVNPVIVKHEMDDSPTSGGQSSFKAAKAVIPIMPKSVEQVYRMRNVQLAGKSTNHIREGHTTTTFSIYDFGFTSETV